jgi:TonB-dependent starch-binding outer membrane protein SusC
MKAKQLLLSLILIFPALFFSNQLLAQQRTIRGVVTTESNGESLIGASVTIKGTALGTITDVDGSYYLEVPGQVVLVFSYTGYKSKEISVNNREVVNIALAEDVMVFQEIVVVGYGTMRKSQVTGAISSIRSDDFRDQPLSNIASSIQGRVSGLNVITPSGTPGAGLIVNVRGSLNPLYVVDGVPMLSESNSALSTSFDTDRNEVGKGQNISSISDINPNDIASIEVLKDASAAAIYGARAANGVILITTKRGEQGKTAVNFNWYTGFQKVARKIDFMNSQQMVDLVEEARRNDLARYQADNTVFGEDFDPSVLTEPLENFNLDGTNTDWLDEVLQTAPINNYEMSIRGGNDKTKFFMSTGFLDQDGIIIENSYKRFNYRLNLDHEATNRLSLGSNIAASYSANRRSFNDNTYTGTITNALGASPLMPVFDEDGNYVSFEDYQVSWLSDNPVKSAKEIKPNTNTYRLVGTVFGEYKLVGDLKFRSSFSSDYTQLSDHQYLSPITADAEAVGGEVQEANFRAITWLNENTLNWQKQTKNHDFTILGGITAQRTAVEKSSVVGQGFPSGSLDRVSSAANIVSASSTGTSFSLLSYIGRVNYGYKDRYILSASLRSDGSSRFSKSNQFGVFPSASVAWRIGQEDFFNEKGILSDLKIRASYGITGDQEIGDFQSTTFYSPTRYDGTAGIGLRNIADPNLTWQSNKMANIGFDFELKDGKYSGSLELFKSTKTNLLSEDIVPGTSGFSTVTRNSGEVENKGVELNLGATLLTKKHLKWNAAFNFNYVHNEITKLSTDEVLLSAYSDISPTHILKVGQSIGTFWGVKYLGIDPETGDALFEDLDGNGEIDNDDAQIIGHAMPKFFGGLSNTVKYKSFDLSVFLRYSFGNQVYNLIRATYENMGYGNDGGLSSIYANNSTNVLDRWRKPGDNAAYPRASFIEQNYVEGSSMYLEKGSFVRAQNITLGYTFKDIKWSTGLRFYVEAQNAFLLSRYKGFDPEVSSTGGSEVRTAGVDFAAYPQARTFIFGINMGF